MTQRPLNVGLIGLGTVGAQVAERMLTGGPQLSRRAGVELCLRRVLVRDLKKRRAVEIASDLLTVEPADLVEDPAIDVVVEVAGGDEPMRSYLERAIRAGKHVITANKVVMAKHGPELLDLAAEKQKLDDGEIRAMQALKTGALFRFACEAGAVMGRASAEKRERLARFGDALGLAFQLADDLIDATGKASKAGKATAKDADRGKATLVGLHGVAAAQKMLDEAVEQAIAIAAPFGARGAMLADAARFAGKRDA